MNFTPDTTIAEVVGAYCRVACLQRSSEQQLRRTAGYFTDFAQGRLGRPAVLSDLLDGLANEWSMALVTEFRPMTVRGRLKVVLALWRFAASYGAIAPPSRQYHIAAWPNRDAGDIPAPPAERKPLSLDSTLLELFDEYRVDRSITRETALQVLMTARQFSGYFMGKRGKAPTVGTGLDRREVHEWIDDMLRTYTPATVNSKRANLVALWNFASEPPHELVRAPVKVKKATMGDDPPEAWTVEEFERLLVAARDTPGQWHGVPAGLAWETGLLIIWDTACRFSELFEARVEDVNFDQGTLWVQSSRRKGRRAGKVYPLHRQTLALIRATLDAPPREKLWPFPWRKEQAWRHFDAILERAGLPGGPRRKFHCLRRTSESYAATTMGPDAAAEAVGHTVAVARNHYLSPGVYKPPALIDALPRPRLGKLSLLGRVAAWWRNGKGA